jgi:pimeloyl-ACP methyl ester carboxylesterase
MKTINNFIRRHVSISFAVLGGFFVGAALFFNPAAAHAASVRDNCETVSIPVALGSGQSKDYDIHGELCLPSSGAPQSVDLLLPGGTYDSLYWDFPYNDYQYSYVKRTLDAGRATFNMDRIGTGESSIPNSAKVTFDADVYTAHQVVQWLRSERDFNDVTAVGHSTGSGIAVQEAAVYNDTDRVVATGLIHSPGFKLISTLLVGGLYPAALDPQFAGAGLDPLYLTTTPGKRGPSFYSPQADPKVIAYDEANKDIVSGVEAPEIVSQVLLPPALNSSSKVTAPVLEIAGDQDILCGFLVGADCSSQQSVYNYEKPYYPKAANFTFKQVPGAGHNLPLHPSADQSFDMIDQWIKTH